MKRILHSSKILNTKQKITGILLFLLITWSMQYANGQEETTMNKSIVSGDQCNQFDIELNITGEPTSRPVEVVLVIDRSGSMDDSYPWPITHAKNAAIEFADSILNRNNPTGLNKIGIVSYSDYATINRSLTTNYSDVVTAINGLRANGYTNIADGFVKAKNELDVNSADDECRTIKAIVLLTDGIANRAPGGLECATWPESHTDCTLAAIAAGQAAHSYSVYTVGLFGAISGNNEVVARSTMNQAQNSGFWETENTANLSTIYAEITNQLIWAANDVVVTETVANGFSIVSDSALATKGHTSINGQVITWSIDAIYDETVTLNYTVEANEGTCSTQTPSTVSVSYENSYCEDDNLSTTNPSVCVPCPEITNYSVSQSSSCSCDMDFTATFNDQSECPEGSTSYEWIFYLDDIQIGSASQLAGTFNIPGGNCIDNSGKTFKGILTVTYTGTEDCTLEKTASTETVIPQCCDLSVGADSNSPICEGETLELYETIGDAISWSWTGPNNFSSTLQNPEILSASSNASGTYKVVGTDINNCTDSTTIDVTVYEEPNVSISPAGPYCNISGSVQLIASPSGGTFSGTGVTATGLFTPANANIGNNIITYSYTDNNGCSGSDEITISVIKTPDVFDPVDTFYCTEYILPEIQGTNLTGNQVYRTQPFGEGEIIPVGTSITTSQLIYVYDETSTDPNCFDQHGFIIDIYYPPEIKEEEDQIACDSFILPTIGGVNLTNPAYYTETNQGGTRMETGDVITSSQTLYIYDRTGILMENCDDEVSFRVTIITSPEITDIFDQDVCEYYVLPAISGSNLSGNEAYYSQSGGIGTIFQEGDTIRTTQTIYIYDEVGTSTICSDEESFAVTILDEPSVSIDPIDPLCEDDQPIQLIGSPTGGIFSGTGVSETGVFTPSNASTGNNIITYIFNDNNECSGSSQITIVVNESPSVTLNEAGPFCEDASPVQLIGSPSGGEFSGTGVNASGLFTPGNANIGDNIITYTYTDGNSCTNSDEITIVINALPTVTLNEIDPLCANSEPVQLVGTPSGGTFSGTGVSATGLFTPRNASIGNNTITYTYSDENGCTNSDEIIILIYGLPNVHAYPIGGDCIGDSVFLYSEANGVEPLSFRWQGPNSFTPVSQQNVFLSVSATVEIKGHYSVIVTDGNGCTSWDGLEIEVNPLPEVGLNDPSDECITGNDMNFSGFPTPGTNSIGTFTSNAGTALTDNRDGTATLDISVAGEGTYNITYTFTDDNGCQNDTTVSVEVFDEPTVTLTEAGPFCEDASPIQLIGSPSGGTFSGTGVSASGLFTPANANIGNNTITYNYTTGSGCEGSDQITIVVNNKPLVTAENNGPVCLGNTLTLRATGSGYGNLSYNWEGPDSFTSSQQNPTVSSNATAAMAGEYTVTVTDGNGCTNTHSTTVTVNNLPTVELNDPSDQCSNGTDMQFTGNPTPGALSTGIFSSNAGAAFTDNGNGTATLDVSAAGAGSYNITYTFTDDNGCQNDTTVSVEVFDEPTVTLTEAGPFCEDASPVQLIGSPSGGAFSGNGVSVSGLFTPANANIGNNTITYNYTTGSGCEGSDQITIVVNDLPTVTLNPAGAFCSDAGAVQLVGSPIGGSFSGNGVNATGMFTPANANIGNNVITYTYTDNNECTNSDEITIVIIQTPDVYDIPDTTVCESYVLPPIPGQHLTAYAGYFTATNGGGTKYAPGASITSSQRLYIYDETDTEPSCSDQEDFMVTVTSPELTLGKSYVQCNGGDNGKAWVVVTEGTPPYTYLWDDPLAQTTDTAIGLVADWYTVVATDANGCSAIDSVKVKEPSPISFNLKIDAPIVCYKGSTTARIINLTGGSPGFSYLWSTGSTAISSTVYAGWNFVTVTDTYGCEKSDSIFVSQPDSMVAEITLIDSVACYGEYNAVATVNASGANGNYHYLWDNGATTKTVTNLNSGKHWVKVKSMSEFGYCYASDTIIVEQPDPLIATATKVTSILCYGDSSAIAAVSVEGGTKPYTYLWDDELNQTTDTAVGLPSGLYTVLVTDANGCEDEAQVNIPEPTKLKVSILEKTNVKCYGAATASATAKASGGTPPYNYYWNTIPQQTGEKATGLIVGTYMVIAVDAKGCMDSVTVTIEGIDEDLEIEISHANNQCPGDANGTATAFVSGGTSPYNYNWDTDPIQDSSTAIELVAGFYTVTVIDANECIATDTVTITQKDTIPPVAICKDFTARLDANGEVVVTVADVDGGCSDNCADCCQIDKYIYPTKFDCDDIGEQIVTLVVTDAAGNKDSCEAKVTVVDEFDPIALCKDTTIYLDENGQFFLEAEDIDDGSYDNCTVVTLEIVPNIMSCEYVNENETPENVALFVYDTYGNFDVCIADVTVLDSIPPMVECPDDFNIFRDTTCEFRIKDYTVMAQAIDNCIVDRKTQSPAALTIIEIPTLVTIYAFDKSENVDSCSFWVTPIDSIIPTLICPDDHLVAVDGNCEITLLDYRDSADISKHCQTEGDLTVIQTPEGGTVVTDTTEVTITVTDEMGNMATCSFDVIPIDTASPTIECPAPITVECIDNVPDADITLVTALDNCDDDVVVEFMGDVSDGNTCPEIITRTYKATDDAGNFATCTQIITVMDITDPTFTVPDAITIYKNDTCGYDASVEITGDVTDENDNCSINIEATFEDEVIENGICEGSASIIRTWTLTDECGNSVSDQQTITVLDTTSPTFTVPEDVTVYKNENCDYDASIGITGDVTDEADNCSSELEATYEDQELDGSCEEEVIIERTWSLVDDCENTTTKVQLITVKDTLAPIINCDADNDTILFVNENCEVELPSFTEFASASDNCTSIENLVITQIPVAGTVVSGDESPIEVWIFAEDECNNIDSCNLTIILSDTISPMVDCPENDSIPLNENCVAVLPDYTFELLSDNCTDSTNIIVEQAPTAGFSFIDPIEVMLYATDESGNMDSCSFNVTPYAIDEDVVNCPADTTIYVDDNCEALIPELQPQIIPASCTDVNAVYSWDQIPAAGSVVRLGDTTVVLSVYVEQVLARTCDVNISVVDTTIDVVCPEDQTLFADENCTAIVPDVTFEIEVIENCSPQESVIITQSPVAGTSIGLGETSVTVSVTDLSGNVDSCSFNINVVDTIPPAIVCPDDQEVPLNEVCEIVIADYTSDAELFDNCSTSENITVSQLPISGTIVTDTTEITLFATDEAGNPNSCSFFVIPTISDSTVVACPDDVTIVADENCEATVPELVPDITIASCTDATDFSVVQSPLAGETIGFGVTTVTITVSEGGEVIEICEVDVTVIDDEINIICPDDLTLEVIENCSAIVPDLTGEVTIDENCAPLANVVVTQSIAPGTSIGIGTTTVTITAADENGNTASCSVDIEVIDNLNPTIACPVNATAETLPGECDADVVIELPELDDNCPGVTATNNYNGTANASDNYPIGVTTVMWNATDASGNTSECIMTVTIIGAPDAIDDSESTEKDTPVEIDVLANDIDCDNNIDPTTVTITIDPINGSVTIDPVSGEVTYTPNDGFDGTDGFTYQVCDADGLCDEANVTINIDNNPPVAQNDINVTVMNIPVSGNVLTNDSDPDGDPLTVNTTPVSDPSNGTVILNTNGTYTYTPATDYVGNDIFVYQVCDNGGLCDTAVLSISITDDSTPNNPPIAVNDNYVGVINTPVSGDLLANDSDPDGDNITIVTSVVTPPSVSGGNLTINADGTFNYTIPTDFIGIVTFEYEIFDDGTPELRDTAIVTIEIFDNTIPNRTVAVDDFYSIHIGETVNGSAASNDYDPEGDRQSFIKISDPTNGTVEFLADGTFTYTPNKGYAGPDNFIYEACDDAAQQACDRATVYIVILAEGNNPPIAENDINVTEVNTPVDGNVLTNDSDPDGDQLTVNTTPVSDPSNGTVTLNADGTYIYTPETDFVGNDIFTYQVCDNSGLCDTADVSISITIDDEENNPPVAVNDNTSGKVNNPVNGDLLANDFDPDGDNITIITSVVTPPNVNGGTLAILVDGTFRYTPPTDFVGVVTFEYEIYDDGTPSLRDTALVTINILGDPVNTENFTFAVDDVYYPELGESVAENVSVNDYDPEGDNQSFTLLSNPAHGTVAFSADGSFTYTPEEGFIGTDSYIYSVCDDGTPQACDKATVYIIYLDRNNPPVAENDINSTMVDTPVGGNVITNDSDPDGDPLTVNTTLIAQPSHGTVAINSNGTYIYTPETDYYGNDEFIYRVCDDGGLCDEAIVSISIIERPEPGVNRPPVAVNDNTRGNIDTPVTGDLLVNDFDPDNDNITIVTTPVIQPQSGSVTINADGTFTYVPETGVIGIITFEYEIFDDGIPSLRDTAVVTIRIEDLEVENTTYAVDDMYETKANGELIVGNIGDNDYDPEGHNQSFSLLDGPYNGTLTFTTNGGFTYEPNTDFVGTDSYTYRACDNGTPQACDMATVYILVEPERVQLNPPTANDDNFAATCNQISGEVLSNDLYALDINVSLVSDVTSGTLEFSSDGTFTYTPEQGFLGDINFVYGICYVSEPDNCDTATVTITMEYNPDCFTDPTPEDDSYFATCHTILGNVIENDNLIEGNVTTSTIIYGTTNGSLMFNSDGTFDYTPNEGFIGLDSFEYEVCYVDYPENCGRATAVINVEFDQACYPCSELFVPNAFSPNGDGVHDVFYVECIEDLYPDAKLMIFNRWGNLVFEREHYGNTNIWDETKAWWDGRSMHNWTVGDEKLPNGTYMYVLILDSETVKKGTVYLNYK